MHQKIFDKFSDIPSLKLFLKKQTRENMNEFDYVRQCFLSEGSSIACACNQLTGLD